MRLPLATLVLVGSALSACSSPSAGDEGLSVAATVYPVEFVARQIAGDRAEVVNVTPPGAEPHDVELTAEQVIDVIGSDLVVYLGRDFQPAVEQALGDAEGTTIDALDHIGEVLEAEEHEEGDADPHFWLDPTRLAQAAEAVADALAENDPDAADGYTARLGDLTARLEHLDARFRDELQGCSSNEIVTSHEAFGYLADRYDLVQTGISGLEPESEPSPQRIAEVADFVGENNVTTIFFETLLSPDAAETIARETGADTAVLDPLESEPDEGDYFTAMEGNLENLRKALVCPRPE